MRIQKSRKRQVQVVVASLEIQDRHSLGRMRKKTERVDIRALLGYYAANSGNSLSTYQKNPSVPKRR